MLYSMHLARQQVFFIEKLIRTISGSQHKLLLQIYLMQQHLVHTLHRARMPQATMAHWRRASKMQRILCIITMLLHYVHITCVNKVFNFPWAFLTTAHYSIFMLLFLSPSTTCSVCFAIASSSSVGMTNSCKEPYQGGPNFPTRMSGLFHNVSDTCHRCARHVSESQVAHWDVLNRVGGTELRSPGGGLRG